MMVPGIFLNESEKQIATHWLAERSSSDSASVPLAQQGATTLVACIGNIFLGDDAFGCAVARVLAGRQLGPDVRVIDFGIRGLDLVYTLLDGWEMVIFVDAAPRGQSPGTLYVIEPGLPEADGGEPLAALDGHQMDPVRVLRLAVAMGAKLPKLRIVGCEPTPLVGDDFPSGLSPPVERALDGAADLVESLIAQECDPVPQAKG